MVQDRVILTKPDGNGTRYPGIHQSIRPSIYFIISVIIRAKLKTMWII